MKQCLSCQEEVGDKFAYCPVCGTPLQASVPAPASEPAVPSTARVADTIPAAVPATYEPAAPDQMFSQEPVPVSEIPPVVDPTPASAPPFVAGSIFSSDGNETAATNGVSDAYLEAVGANVPNYIHDDGEYHLTIMDDSGLVSRLTGELRGVARQSQLTWPEFKRDPIGFAKRTASGYGRMAGGFFGNRYIAIALGVAVLALLSVATVIVVAGRSKAAGTSRMGMSIFAIAAFALLAVILVSWLTRGNSTVVIGGEERDKTAAGVGVAVALGLPLVLVAALIFVFVFGVRRHVDPNNPNADLTVDQMVDIPDAQPTPDPGNAGRDKGNGGGSKAKQEKPSGGGGGGREDPTPASQGKLPPASLTTPIIVAPDPKPPPPTKDPLIVPPTLDADPTLFPTDTSSRNFGDPNSKSTEPSSGPGSGNGIGAGQGGGVGPGTGGGFGPGNGGNTGGGDRGVGGGGPGGGGGGTDYNKVFQAKDVNQKARIISKPTPEYTEEARVNNTTGTVRLQAVFSSSGQITNIRPLNQLPYGLTDKAIAAARRIQFTPAMKDGRAVSTYMVIEYNFNIY